MERRLSIQSTVTIIWELLRRGWVYIPEKRQIYHPVPDNGDWYDKDDETYGMTLTIPEEDWLTILLLTINFN